MGFPTPSFPLRCNIWHVAPNATPTIPPTTPPDLAGVLCQIAQPLDLAYDMTHISLTASPGPAVIIRLPAGTQIKDYWLNTASPARVQGDLIEAPAGSGVIYGVTNKLTVSRGYPTEHVRCVCIRMTPASGAE